MAAFGTMPPLRVLITLWLLVIGLVFVTASKISDLRKCGDKDCTSTLSRATAMARYPANSPLHLSLNRGDIIEIKSKSAGSKPELWGGEIDGRRGYFPKAFVREFDVKIDNPIFEVPTEENEWTKKPPPPQQQDKPQQNQQPHQQQQQPPPPVAVDVVKDETEIDETDLTDVEDGNAAALTDGVDANVDDTPKEEPPQAESSLPQRADPAETPSNADEPKTEEGDQQNGWFGAQTRDPLLQDIEELQKSFMVMTKVQQDTQALNDFLAQQFGTQDAAFASSPPQPDASPDAAQPGEDSSSPESDAGVPDVGPGVDETDIDDSDGDVHPIPAADVDEDTKTADPEMADTDVKTTQEEEEKEAESPYIAGVTVLEDEDEEEEEEAEDVVKEERMPDVEPERAEEKVSETAPGSDKVSQQEDDTETEPAEPSVKVGEEKAEPAAGSDQSSTGSTVVAQDEDRSGKATPSQSGIVEPRDHRPGGQDVVKQVIEEMSQDVPIAGLRVPADQKAEGEVKTDPQNTVQAETGAVTKPDGSLGAGAEGVSAPDAASVDTSATDSAAAPQQKEKEKLLFQSEVEGLGEDEEEEEEEEEEENPAVFHTDTLDALAGSHLKDTSGKEAKEEASQDKVIPGQPSLADQETAGKQPAIQPDKTLSEPAAPSASASHQPVDIDFVAGQVQDSGVALESSQTALEQEQVAAETPTLEGTMTSMQHAAQGVSNTAVPAKTEDTQPAQSGTGDQVPTTVIDGTRFYLENGEIADIVPESSAAQETTAQSPTPKEPDMSIPPAQATQAKSIQPTGVAVLSEVSLQEAVVTTPPPLNSNIPDPTPQTPEKVQNATEGAAAAAGSHAHQPDAPKVADPVQQGGNREQYQTSADFLSRKVLSVNSQVPAGQVPKQGSDDQEVPAQEQGIEWTSEQQGNTQASGEVSGEPPAASDSATTAAEVPASDTLAKAETPASEIEPSASVAVGTASVTIEGEELADKFAGGEDRQTGEEGQQKTAGEDAAATTGEPVNPEGDASSPLPPVAENKVSDAENAQGEKVVQEEAMKSVTPPPDTAAWDGVPPAPAADEATPSPVEQSGELEEPTKEDDPYQMDDYYSRKMSDEELIKSEEEATAYTAGSSASSVVGSLEAHSKAFIDKLPPSIQSLLEQEPLGLSPAMTILVTMTTFIIFMCITCFSCLCSSGGKKTGKKDPLVVVRELEEKLLMAVKEKENLEDLLQDWQSENKQLKAEFSELQAKSGTAKSDLQNVTLHNEVLKNQVTSLQEEISELKGQLAKKLDDVKMKDKKTKDIEKETKKLQESRQKLEQNLQKKENEIQRLQDENENLKTTIQSLTDQVQLLDTSKQQLLAEASDWKEKVDELKERLEQVEQENRQAQETISFKDNELEVIKDCYMQLKAFEKSRGEGEEEDPDAGGDDKDIQEKIQAMMDVSKVNATLRAVQQEKDSLENKLKIEHGARKELEEQLECVRREMESSMADKMKAERQCQEAQTKLSVLSSYFKDKEVQLQRELGEQEALKKQNLSKLDNADETTRTLQKELELSKQQVESLKRELTASERDFRSQIAANEKKAHENWLNARAAERELKECKHEAAVLRQKLTDLECRQMESGGLIRPLPTRGMPPPGMLNGPPPPGMERSPSRASMPPGVIPAGAIPPGAMPPGPPHPPFRDVEFPLTPQERERLPPSHPARHMPPPEPRSPPPRMLPPDSRGSPPRMLPPDARSPPPYGRRGPLPPLDSRSPPMRLPPPDMIPPMRGPLPPHMGPPPMGSPGPRMDSPRDPRQGHSPYGRQPPPGSDNRRHQSQV